MSLGVLLGVSGRGLEMSWLVLCTMPGRHNEGESPPGDGVNVNKDAESKPAPIFLHMDDFLSLATIAD